MNDLMIVGGTEKTMSTREIAELTEKEHKHVMRDVRMLIDQRAINGSNFGPVEYTDAKGEKRPEYLLDFQATMTLITGYNAVLRSKVIKRWRELETGKVQPIATTLLPDEIASRSFIAMKQAAEAFGLKGNAAIISASNAVRKVHGISLDKILEIELINEKQERFFTPTELGELAEAYHGRVLSARAINGLLEMSGLQESVRAKGRQVWMPTERGKRFSVMLDTGKRRSNGAMIQQLKWYESVLLEII